MSQLLAPSFGLGSGGDHVVSGNTTDPQVNSTATGTISTNSLAATNASFAIGQLILVHQTQGTGNGQWELNRITGYSAGTITTLLQLTFGYVAGAQVVVVPEYTSFTINGGVTLSSTVWNGSVGGIFAIACSGQVNIPGNLTVAGAGFRSTGTGFSSGTIGDQGEGNTSSSWTTSNSANGNAGGGGGGNTDSGHVEAGAGAGGGNGTSGGSPAVRNQSTSGTGGSTSGAADLTTATFGGAGGEGGNGFSSGDGKSGGSGAGAIFIFCYNFICSGDISLDGLTGTATSDRGGPGGGGAGGSFILKCVMCTLGANLIHALGGVGGANTGSFQVAGGPGGVGRIRIECGAISGSTNPAFSQLLGGLGYLGGLSPSA